MQSASKSNQTLQELLKRQNEMQYEAMAQTQAGQEVSEEFTNEYIELEKMIAQLTAENK
jgi:pyruvate dehydrogenase complex dehydrogenase (E1) component